MPTNVGIKSPDVPLVAALDEVLGNRTVDGIRDTGRLPISNLVTQIKADPQMATYLAGYDVSYDTRAQLYADLAWVAGKIGRVFGDPTTAFRGVYKKAGASGAGSWTKIGDLPAEAVDATNVASAIHGSAAKTTPVDADALPLIDSAASNALKKITWANVKAAMWTGFGALIAGGTAKARPAETDTFALADSEASNATKSVTLASLKASMGLAAIIAAITRREFVQSVLYVHAK